MTDSSQRSMGVRALGTAVRVSMLGWDLAVPMVGAAVLGRMLNERYRTGPVATVALLVLGVIVGAYNVWRQLPLNLARGGRATQQGNMQDGLE